MKIKKLDMMLLVLAILICSLDLFIKTLIVQTFNNPYPMSDSISVIGDFFKLTYVRNFGITFGMLSNLDTNFIPYILGVISISALVVLIYFYRNLEQLIKENAINYAKLCLAFILGGALGNIIDRIQRGFVVDYLDFGLYGYRWYTFNLADVFIVSGCIALTIIMTVFENKKSIEK